ncbi:MAG: hypothetical protein ACREN4_06760 [Candidatus Dormibacteria bacterium]
MPKAALLGALAVILNPALDLPAWIPVVGQLDTLALTVLAVRTFNSQVPAELRREIEAEIREGRSQFDLDLRRGAQSARLLAGRLPGLPGGGGAGPKGLVRGVPPWYRSTAQAGQSADPGGTEQQADPARAREEHTT